MDISSKFSDLFDQPSQWNLSYRFVQAMKMVLSLSFFFFIALSVAIVTVEGQLLPENHLNHRITVAFSERRPFVILKQNHTPQGLDVQMIENFANQMNLRIDYVAMNTSLNYAFASEKHFSAFMIQTNLRYFLEFSYYHIIGLNGYSYRLIVKSIYSWVLWTKLF